MDNKKLNLGRVVAVWLIAAVGVILSIVLFVNIAPDAVDNPTQEQMESQASSVSSILNFTLFLVGLVMALIVIFLLVSIVTNFGKQKKSLITTGLMAVLALIFYAMGDSEIPQSVIDKGATEGDAVMASAGISLTMFLIGIAVVLAVFMGFVTKYVLKK